MNTDRDYLILKKYGCTYLGKDFDTRTHPYAQGVPTPYCGSHDLVDGKLYCKEHYGQLFQKGTALRKRKKDQRKADAIRNLMSDFDAVVAELESEGFDFTAQAVDEQLEQL